MRQLLIYSGIAFLFFVSACSNSEKLFPKKYLGNYEGMQEEYEVVVNEKRLTIPEAKYELALSYGTLYLISPKQKTKGSYRVVADTKMYYSLKVELETGVIEEWQLWKKGKRLIRKPSTPQPELVFVRI